MHTFKSLMILCTRVKATLLESKMLMYVDALQSFTQVTAAASVSCLLFPCGPNARFTLSINAFFLECRGEQGAPESAFTISSKTFCKVDIYFHLEDNKI